MSQFSIFDMASGEELGRYFARSVDEAKDAMARMAGFSDFREACTSVPHMAEQLVITEL